MFDFFVVVYAVLVFPLCFYSVCVRSGAYTAKKLCRCFIYVREKAHISRGFSFLIHCTKDVTKNGL